MSRPNNRRAQPGTLDEQTILMFSGLLVGVLVLGALDLAVHLGGAIAGTPGPIPANPISVAAGLARGTIVWPGLAAWLVLAAIVMVLVSAVVGVAIVVMRRGRERSRVDPASAYMGRGRDIASLSVASAHATAQRLGVRTVAGDPVPRSACGVTIGATIATHQRLIGSYEDLHIDIWGPRTGKTTSRAVPAILDAPGPVLVTSNKRDVVDATRDVRGVDGRVWVFDPQDICAEGPDAWWWNPLSYVTDEVRAAKLAEHFASGSREPEARTDAYFDPAGQDLLAGLLLAAALDQRPITDVYVWLTRPGDDTPAEILFRHGYALTGHQVAGASAAPEKQRGGIFGTARQMASCLTNRRVAAWITVRDRDTRDHLDVQAFVRSGDTLYSLSKEGKGTAGPLVTALTVAVVEAAEELASVSAGGRLATPLLGVLDEAANVCRWRELPNLYSHFGSRGIVLMTILQSWAQGEGVWGPGGMKALWSAANVRVYGGGVSDTQFLEELSQLIGTYDRATSSVTTGRQQRSVSRQLTQERILDVAALGAMPKGRAVVFASGNRPVLVRTLPWMSGPHAEAVQASITAHDPQASQTLRQAQQQMATVQATDQDAAASPSSRGVFPARA